MADSKSDLPAFGVSTHRRRNSVIRPSVKPPLIEIELAEDRNQFAPGDFLMCEYRLRAVEGLVVNAIETSVLWIAGGKGSEDIGVHFFQRISKDAINPTMLQGPHRISTVLPNSPLSYPGMIVQVRWCIRVRMFYGDELELNQDHGFILGDAQVPDTRGNSSADNQALDSGTIDDSDPQDTDVSKATADA
jgi:hypothetical protein